MSRTSSIIKQLMVAGILMSASVSFAGNKNTCYQQYTDCSSFTKEQCAVSAANVGTASAPSWQPCTVQQDSHGCPTGCMSSGTNPPSTTQSTYCSTVSTIAQPSTVPAYKCTSTS